MSSGLESLYPKGYWMCSHCIEFILIEDLAPDDEEPEKKMDVCKPCRARYLREI